MVKEYSPGLAYSEMLDGPLCRYCVLFPQVVKRGKQGAFILYPSKKYSRFTCEADDHVRNVWHKGSFEDATNFVALRNRKALPIDEHLNTSYRNQIEENRRKMYPIISSIIFCGMHDLALRGKTADSGNFHDFIEFRAESGDVILKSHLTSGPGNAKYTSVRTQNTIIDICAAVLRDDIVRSANASVAFSILADETTDISGTEQLSLGVRFAEEACIREEFLGYVPVSDRTADGLANTITTACSKFGLNMENCVGQGYDGCSTMSGKEGGVQAIVRRKYPKALFVHCSSHRLNLVFKRSKWR